MEGNIMSVIDSFKNSEFRVRCVSNNQAKLFLRICYCHNIEWAGVETMDKTNWHNYGTKTTYSCNVFGYQERDRLYYGNYYEDAIYFKDFMELYCKEFGNEMGAIMKDSMRQLFDQ